MRAFGRGAGVLLLALLLGLAASSASHAAEAIGFVAGVSGRADLLRAGEVTWTAIAIDDDVFDGDTLRTGPGAALKLVLVDDTTLGLGEDTELLMENLVIGPEALTEPSILRQWSGQIRTRVGEAFGGTTRIEIHTPTAIMGVKGTEGTTRIDGGEQGAPSDDGAEEEISTLVRNWEGGITAAMLNGIALPVPPGQCRIVYIDRIGDATDCPGDFVPVNVPGPARGELARLQSDLLVGSGPPAVSAGPDEVVGGSLPLDPPDPVIEDRTDADAFAGIGGGNPLSDLDFGFGETPPDAGGNPLDDLDFGFGETPPDAGGNPLDDLDFGFGETPPDVGGNPLDDLDFGFGEVPPDTP